MGRFDELQQLEDAPRIPVRAKVENLPPPEEKARKPANGQAGKPATLQDHSITKTHDIGTTNPQTRKPLPPRPASIYGEIPEKYTTRLLPSMVRHIKIFAAERDINDYEVVEKALTEYFERNT
jgi:hypothetical protein